MVWNRLIGRHEAPPGPIPTRISDARVNAVLAHQRTAVALLERELRLYQIEIDARGRNHAE